MSELIRTLEEMVAAMKRQDVHIGRLYILIGIQAAAILTLMLRELTII